MLLYGCNSAGQTIIDKSNSKANYIFSNIYWNDIITKEFSSNQVTILKQANPKNTPEDYFDGTGEVLVDLIISIVNTGEYSESKLYFIKDLNNPTVVDLTEDLTKGRIILSISYRTKNGKQEIKKIEMDI